MGEIIQFEESVKSAEVYGIFCGKGKGKTSKTALLMREKLKPPYYIIWIDNNKNYDYKRNREAFDFLSSVNAKVILPEQFNTFCYQHNAFVIELQMSQLNTPVMGDLWRNIDSYTKQLFEYGTKTDQPINIYLAFNESSLYIKHSELVKYPFMSDMLVTIRHCLGDGMFIINTIKPSSIHPDVRVMFDGYYIGNFTTKGSLDRTIRSFLNESEIDVSLIKDIQPYEFVLF